MIYRFRKVSLVLHFSPPGRVLYHTKTSFHTNVLIYLDQWNFLTFFIVTIFKMHLEYSSTFILSDAVHSGSTLNGKHYIKSDVQTWVINRRLFTPKVNVIA